MRGYTYNTMAPRNDTETTEQLTAREAARIRARDRKRRTTMVVDNAGIRRILLERVARRRRPGPPAAGS